MSASMGGPSAFSEDGKYYSVIGNDGRCKIWETGTNTLKQEFTPDLHLSAPLSCLYWIQLDGGKSNPKWKSRKRKSSLSNDGESDNRNVTHCIAFGSTTGKVLIYSLTHAKVESVLEDENPSLGEQQISCMDWSRRNGLYTCSQDSTIREWSIEDLNVKNKFRMCKIDKELQSAKTTAIKVPNYQAIGSAGPKILVTASCQLRVWSLDSRTVLRRMVGHTGHVCHLDVISFPQDGRFYVLSGSQSDRILSCWAVSLTEAELSSTLNLNDSLTESKKSRRRTRTKSGGDESKLESVPSCNFLMEDIARQVCCRIVEEGSAAIKLAAITRRGVVHYYEHTLNGVSTKPIKPNTTIQVVSEESSQVKLAAALCGALHKDKLLIGYSSGPGIVFERIMPDTSEKTQVLIRSIKDKESTKKESAKLRNEDITKIRQGDSKDPSVVYLTSSIGRGDEESLKRPYSSKKVDVPMEMRLANLSLAQPAGKPGIETSNMAQLLVQALHSKDAKLLQTVFECTDPDVAYNTMNRLPIQYLPTLLEHLTTMMAKKTNQCKSACIWATALCKARSSALLELGTSARPLLAALWARAPHLPRLLALSARLALLTHPRGDDSAQKPTLDYKDSSSEDEDGDEDMDEALMNNAADDSASWNEDDDEEEPDHEDQSSKADSDQSSKADSDQEMSE